MESTEDWVAIPADAVVRTRGEHPSLDRAAAYLIDQIHQRTDARGRAAGTAATAPDIIVRLEDIGVERFTIRVAPTASGAEVEIVAHATGVVLAAVGSFLRSLRIDGAEVHAPIGVTDHQPVREIRGQVLANHKQTNTYDHWSAEQWEECLTELAALGNNLVVLYPLHPSRWHGVLPWADEPWFDSPEREAEWRRQYAIQLHLPLVCRELGIRYGAYISPNDIWPEEVAAHPDWAPYSQAFVCPNHPAARESIMSLRRRIFSELPHLDVLFIPSKDDGGCPGCEACEPWSATYLPLVEEQVAALQEFHPEARVWLSQQGLPWDQTVEVAEWVTTTRPAWLEAVAYGPFSEAMLFDSPDAAPALPDGANVFDHHWTGPRRLAALLPESVPVVLYPDEVHAVVCQYPLLDADPAIEYVWWREDGPVPRIADTVEQFGRTIDASGGAAPYSEGDTDDVNKFAWSLLLWDPTLTAETIAERYAQTYFGARAAEPAAALVLEIEQCLHRPVRAGSGDRLRALSADVLTANETLAGNWRWLSLQYCVELLAHIERVVLRDRHLTATLRYRVAEWYDDVDLSAGLERTAAHLRAALAIGQDTIDTIDRIRLRLDQLHALRVRSATRVQSSYRGFDRVLQEWDAMVAKRRSGADSVGWAERRQAVMDVLVSAERALDPTMRGIQLLEHRPEFAWETGPTRWHSR